MSQPKPDMAQSKPEPEEVFISLDQAYTMYCQISLMVPIDEAVASFMKQRFVKTFEAACKEVDVHPVEVSRFGESTCLSIMRAMEGKPQFLSLSPLGNYLKSLPAAADPVAKVEEDVDLAGLALEDDAGL